MTGRIAAKLGDTGNQIRDRIVQSRPMPNRIFMGLTEIASFYENLSSGVRSLGVDVVFVDLSGNPYRYAQSSQKPAWISTIERLLRAMRGGSWDRKESKKARLGSDEGRAEASSRLLGRYVVRCICVCSWQSFLRSLRATHSAFAQ